MTTLPLTNKPSLADRVSQFLRPALGIKTLTKEENIKLLTNKIVDELFTSKYEGENLKSEDLGKLANDIPAEIRNRLLERAKKHDEALNKATEYHTKEMTEAYKAAESIKI